jgi:hypothetical protein
VFVPFFIAWAAPATACGDSLPVTGESCLPLGCGSKLTRRFAAMELAGRVGFEDGLPRERGSLEVGWKLALRLVVEERADIEDLEARGGLGREDVDFESTCCE